MTSRPGSLGRIDSLKDTIHVPDITGDGERIADQEFATTTAGYLRAVAWMIEHGPVEAVRIEATSSYGVGITAAVRQAGIRWSRSTGRALPNAASKA